MKKVSSKRIKHHYGHTSSSLWQAVNFVSYLHQMAVFPALRIYVLAYAPIIGNDL